jgi:hypothetical protein
MSIELAPSLRTALEERGGWRNAVTWLDGFGVMHAAVEDCPGAWRMAQRALFERFGEDWGAWRPSLRCVATDPGVREYVEVTK